MAAFISGPPLITGCIQLYRTITNRTYFGLVPTIPHLRMLINSASVQQLSFASFIVIRKIFFDLIDLNCT